MNTSKSFESNHSNIMEYGFIFFIGLSERAQQNKKNGF